MYHPLFTPLWPIQRTETSGCGHSQFSQETSNEMNQSCISSIDARKVQVLSSVDDTLQQKYSHPETRVLSRGNTLTSFGHFLHDL
eukprot:Nitzschia sp. Nitz4//scaffold233_size31335//13875//14151//NITZ4_007949-RA/size31335-snap-gene-0.14-mRNA-1//1//CDS//3329543373//9239//frame0